MHELIKCIRGIYDIEKKYSLSQVDRNFFDKLNSLVKNVILICANCATKPNINYKIYVWLCLEKIKQQIILEDKLSEIFETEISRFIKRIETLNTDITKTEKHFIENADKEKDIRILTKRNNYPQKVTKFFKKWLSKNLHNPYPSELDKNYFSEKTGLDINQINNWFVNARRRIISKHYKSKIF